MSYKENRSTFKEHCVEIYVPNLCLDGKQLPEELRGELLKEVKTKFSSWFGGTSRKEPRIDRIEGSWLHGSGELANEPIDIVYSNTDAESLEEYFEELPVLANEIATRLKQEAVAFRVDGKMTLIYGDSSGALERREPKEIELKCALQASLMRVSSLKDIRDLFINLLHYDHESTEIATLDWPDSLQDILAKNTLPEVIAGYNGFKVIHLQLAAEDLRKGQERQLIQRIRKDDPTLRALFVVSNYEQNQWHLINTKDTQEASKTTLHLRFFRIGKGQQVRTAAERLHLIDIEALDPEITAQELQDHHNDAFDVESVSQDFFNEISNWYFWALSQVEFPQDTVVEGEEEKHRATSLIRFLTRIIFCWFLKEKGLIPESLFNRKELEVMLVDLDEDHCTYHEGILQNLFFATLNQRMGKDRRFVTGNDEDDKTDLYHYPEHFLDSEKAPGYFKEIPFLNGGLFECLDREDPDNENQMVRIDGFTTKGTRASIPNILFFTSEEEADLSGKEAFGSAKYKKAKVRGLLNILHSYNFTVEENTPVDEEIALDPELLGKVFENLLASYDEDSSKSARKATGSFYTPRPIVEYMVDESLKGHLVRSLVQGGRDSVSAQAQLSALLSYEDHDIDLSNAEREALLNSIHNCKILDPACGSGAFPMGMLQKLLHLVQKLDDGNEIFERIQIAEAQKITDRDERLKKIEKIGRDFAENNVDYARKLYLIENCLYGVDIQPIAIQISKLRFFISLICDQKTNKDKGKNHGVEALPNLETKIVAANTLISLPDFGNEDLFLKQFTQPIEKKIEEAYHRYFSVQNRQKKLKIQTELKALREQLGNEILQNIGAQESSSITEKARSIAKWDPFDAQASSDFFDARWMFGESLHGGFNIVIGNPPYGGTKISDGLKNELELGSKDIYGAFISKAFQRHLAPNGLLSFIVSDTFMTIKTHKPLREQILKHKIHKMIRVHPDTFKATVNTAIIILEKQDSDTITQEATSNACLMADLTNVSIHENFQRFLELLHLTAQAGAEDQIDRANAHIMKGEDWWSESSPEYALYSYPKELIRTNSNIPFFVASPKLFSLMDDTIAPVEYREINGKQVPVRMIEMNGTEVELTKLGDIAEVKVGLQTGDNDAYLFQNPEARGNYRSIEDYREYLLTEQDLERIRSDEQLRLAVIENGIPKDDSSSERYFGGRYIVPYDKGGESDTGEGWMPNYWVPTDYFIDWSESALSSIKSRTIADVYRRKGRLVPPRKTHYETTVAGLIRNPEFYFITGITFSDTGFYAPTFRLSGGAAFDVMGMTIFSSMNARQVCGLLASRLTRFWVKNCINTTVHTQVDGLKLVPCALLFKHESPIGSAVASIQEKQKHTPRYDYASNEQLEIDRLVYEAYGLNEDDIREVENWYARRYPALVAAQKANLKKS
jgi:hypothetical protein